ncbi:hypothetical protein GCM10023158_34550 [Gluconacetobacter tumulicola]
MRRSGMSETIFLSKAVDPSGRIAAERLSSMLHITRSSMGGAKGPSTGDAALRSSIEADR